jgi:MOSC domain-containing protein YiiM
MGTVERIHLIAEHGGPPQAVEAVPADAGRGLRGDRYHGDGAGNLTLIEAEALERLAAGDGLDLTAGQSRRNVITRGVDLGQLVGRQFRIGDALCHGQQRCEPCRYLAGVTGPAVLRGLLHTGLRALILESGTVRVGDAVEPVGP